MAYISRILHHKERPGAGRAPNLAHPQLGGCISWLPFSALNGEKVHDAFNVLPVVPSYWTNSVLTPKGLDIPPVANNGVYWTLATTHPIISALSSNFTIYIDCVTRSAGQSGSGHWLSISNTNKYNSFSFRTITASLSNLRFESAATINTHGLTDWDPNFGTFGITYGKRHQMAFGQRDGVGSFVYVAEDQGNIYGDTTTQYIGTANTATRMWIGERNGGGRAGDLLINEIRIFDRALDYGHIEDIIRRPYAPYSKVIPAFVSAGAGPTGWQGTMNEIATPTAINEQARTSITSVNEVT